MIKEIILAASAGECYSILKQGLIMESRDLVFQSAWKYLIFLKASPLQKPSLRPRSYMSPHLFARIAEQLRCLPESCLPSGGMSHAASLLITDLGSPPTVSGLPAMDFKLRHDQTGTTHFLAWLFTK